MQSRISLRKVGRVCKRHSRPTSYIKYCSAVVFSRWGLCTTYITSNLCAWTMFYQCQWFYEPIRVLDMCKGTHILGVVYCVRAVDFTSGPIDCCTACHHDAMHCIKCGNLASRIGNNMHSINSFPFHRKVLYTVLYLSKL